MNKKLFQYLALSSLMLGFAACSNDDGWKTVDGLDPSCELAASAIRTEAGHSIKIAGTLSDNDGISKIELWCPDLYMKKTIDIIDIYGEPLKTYDLDFNFKIERHKKADAYNVEVTVFDIAGKKTTHTVVVTLDGDYTNPVFVVAPSAETTVLINEGQETLLPLEFSVTDNIGLDKVIVSINKYDLATKDLGASVNDYFPMTVEIYGEDTYEFSETVILPDEEGAYLVQVEAYDMPAQNDEVRKTVATGVVTVLGGVDFAKMYLSDVATAAELNADIFGVPMRVDKTGECQYRARYYTTKPNTEVYFIPQKGALSPICYGLDPTDNTRLINSPGNVLPLVLPQSDTYYEINFNTESGVYSVESYVPADYMDPIFFDYGSESLNQWFAYVDDGTDNYVPTDDAWMREFYFGYAGGPGEVTRFAVDPNNPHLYYWDTPQTFNAGDDLHFIFHNWHDAGWWNFVTWRVDDSAECDIFYYYGGIVKKAYLDWYWPGENIDWKKWKDDEGYRKNWVPDNWCTPHVNTTGDYVLYFDTHLGRAKLVPAK